jgi:hypothetical protein
MPEADLVLSVGDLMDRGKDSRKVIEYFMTTPNTECLFGNHEQLMLHAFEYSDTYSWHSNGGFKTVESYGGDASMIPKEHLTWIKSRPLYYDTDGLFVSHAPVTLLNMIPKHRFSQNENLVEKFVWARVRPMEPYPNKFMVYGHNGRLSTTSYLDPKGQLSEIAQCIDNTHAQQVAGMHWPSKEIFTQDFL